MANPAAEPQSVEDVQGDGRWMSMHNSFLHDAKEKEPEVVLIGDSIIAQMTQSRLWEQMFEPLHCLNFGIGGDRTQHILWRIHNGELDQIEPKVIVLLAGTNNFDDSAEQVTEGILAIVKLIRDKQPSTHLIVVGLLPRGEKPNHLREKHCEINKRLAEELKGAPMTSFLKIDEKEFMSSEGVIRRSVMYDFLHLTSDIGYQKLCDPLLEEIQNVLGIFMKVESTALETASLAGDLDHSPSN
ncbi:platelet-activating factor acetylhydrolase IB subunit beta [Biomphalaria pfeifferi]|uniref:Platelet-activating factor acetylhydrolase IB subunit beta n=1 Tax=Biomphalaria pfeifferi TaxID=112525 RepID=A0AAD8AS38_BIOPF|nr:platelet-activating factor acetylhydrolase IB subunit beta [Biomphalaria pfeifferi]